MAKKRVQNECFYKQVCQFYLKNEKNRQATVQHFINQGPSKQSLYRMIKRFDSSGSEEYFAISGRPRSARNPEKLRKIEKVVEKNPTISLRLGGEKLRISYGSFARGKKELGYKSYRRIKAPNYKKDQPDRCKKGARKIYEQMLANKILIIDDETYVFSDPEQIPGRKFYSAKSRNSVDDSIRIDPKTKFAQKYLVWQAMDSLGNVSDPYVTTGTINHKVYLEIIDKYLIPFIEKYHRIEDILFWPDLASSHYQKDVLKFLENKKISFVKKKENTPNLPQARPIEKFWALCKSEYSKRRSVPRRLCDFRKIWKNIAEKVANNSGKNLMSGLKSKLRKVAREGPLSIV
uniref:Tc1-like transposase DDE domain-containing protein n=1 Tax=Tetranychus urticae TaxID=32264 RepID=A0A158P562_TETUR